MGAQPAQRLTDYHLQVAAIAPAEVAAAGLAAVADVEDAALVYAARQSLTDSNEPVPLEQVLEEIDITPSEVLGQPQESGTKSAKETQ